MDIADLNKLADDIIDFAKLCANYAIRGIVVSSVLLKVIFD